MLLASMTLDQKIGQMTQGERATVTPEDVRRYHLGSVLSGSGSSPGNNLPADWVAMNDAYWVASMIEDERHLAIPVLFGVDAVHGNNNVRGATLFPHNIGLGAANDLDLIRLNVRDWDNDLWMFPYYVDKKMVPYDAEEGGVAASGD